MSKQGGGVGGRGLEERGGRRREEVWVACEGEPRYRRSPILMEREKVLKTKRDGRGGGGRVTNLRLGVGGGQICL